MEAPPPRGSDYGESAAQNAATLPEFPISGDSTNPPRRSVQSVRPTLINIVPSGSGIVFDQPTGKGLRHIPVAIESCIEVELERGAHDRPPVRGECVLLGLVEEDPCQRSALVEVVDLGATDGVVNSDWKRTHVG